MTDPTTVTATAETTQEQTNVVALTDDNRVDVPSGKTYREIRELAQAATSLADLFRALGYASNSGQATRKRMLRILGHEAFYKLSPLSKS